MTTVEGSTASARSRKLPHASNTPPISDSIRNIRTSEVALLISLARTAQAAGVNVKLYLRDVLQRIATETDVRKLLPRAWKEHFEAEVIGRRNEIVDLLIADQRGEELQQTVKLGFRRRLRFFIPLNFTFVNCARILTVPGTRVGRNGSRLMR